MSARVRTSTRTAIPTPNRSRMDSPHPSPRRSDRYQKIRDNCTERGDSSRAAPNRTSRSHEDSAGYGNLKEALETRSDLSLGLEFTPPASFLSESCTATDDIITSALDTDYCSSSKYFSGVETSKEDHKIIGNSVSKNSRPTRNEPKKMKQKNVELNEKNIPSARTKKNIAIALKIVSKNEDYKSKYSNGQVLNPVDMTNYDKPENNSPTFSQDSSYTNNSAAIANQITSLNTNMTRVAAKLQQIKKLAACRSKSSLCSKGSHHLEVLNTISEENLTSCSNKCAAEAKSEEEIRIMNYSSFENVGGSKNSYDYKKFEEENVVTKDFGTGTNSTVAPKEVSEGGAKFLNTSIANEASKEPRNVAPVSNKDDVDILKISSVLNKSNTCSIVPEKSWGASKDSNRADIKVLDNTSAATKCSKQAHVSKKSNEDQVRSKTTNRVTRDSTKASGKPSKDDVNILNTSSVMNKSITCSPVRTKSCGASKDSNIADVKVLNNKSVANNCPNKSALSNYSNEDGAKVLNTLAKTENRDTKSPKTSVPSNKDDDNILNTVSVINKSTTCSKVTTKASGDSTYSKVKVLNNISAANKTPLSNKSNADYALNTSIVSKTTDSLTIPSTIASVVPVKPSNDVNISNASSVMNKSTTCSIVPTKSRGVPKDSNIADVKVLNNTSPTNKGFNKVQLQNKLDEDHVKVLNTLIVSKTENRDDKTPTKRSVSPVKSNKNDFNILNTSVINKSTINSKVATKSTGVSTDSNIAGAIVLKNTSDGNKGSNKAHLQNKLGEDHVKVLNTPIVAKTENRDDKLSTQALVAPVKSNKDHDNILNTPSVINKSPTFSKVATASTGVSTDSNIADAIVFNKASAGNKSSNKTHLSNKLDEDDVRVLNTPIVAKTENRDAKLSPRAPVKSNRIDVNSLNTSFDINKSTEYSKETTKSWGVCTDYDIVNVKVLNNISAENKGSNKAPSPKKSNKNDVKVLNTPIVAKTENRSTKVSPKATVAPVKSNKYDVNILNTSLINKSTSCQKVSTKSRGVSKDSNTQTYISDANVLNNTSASNKPSSVPKEPSKCFPSSPVANKTTTGYKLASNPVPISGKCTESDVGSLKITPRENDGIKIINLTLKSSDVYDSRECQPKVDIKACQGASNKKVKEWLKTQAKPIVNRTSSDDISEEVLQTINYCTSEEAEGIGDASKHLFEDTKYKVLNHPIKLNTHTRVPSKSSTDVNHARKGLLKRLFYLYGVRNHPTEDKVSTKKNPADLKGDPIGYTNFNRPSCPIINSKDFGVSPKASTVSTSTPIKSNKFRNTLERSKKKPTALHDSRKIIAYFKATSKAIREKSRSPSPLVRAPDIISIDTLVASKKDEVSKVNFNFHEKLSKRTETTTTKSCPKFAINPNSSKTGFRTSSKDVSSNSSLMSTTFLKSLIAPKNECVQTDIVKIVPKCMTCTKACSVNACHIIELKRKFLKSRAEKLASDSPKQRNDIQGFLSSANIVRSQHQNDIQCFLNNTNFGPKYENDVHNFLNNPNVSPKQQIDIPYDSNRTNNVASQHQNDIQDFLNNANGVVPKYIDETTDCLRATKEHFEHKIDELIIGPENMVAEHQADIKNNDPKLSTLCAKDLDPTKHINEKKVLSYFSPIEVFVDSFDKKEFLNNTKASSACLRIHLKDQAVTKKSKSADNLRKASKFVATSKYNNTNLNPVDVTSPVPLVPQKCTKKDDGKVLSGTKKVYVKSEHIKDLRSVHRVNVVSVDSAMISDKQRNPKDGIEKILNSTNTINISFRQCLRDAIFRKRRSKSSPSIKASQLFAPKLEAIEVTSETPKMLNSTTNVKMGINLCTKRERVQMCVGTDHPKQFHYTNLSSKPVLKTFGGDTSKLVNDCGLNQDDFGQGKDIDDSRSGDPSEVLKESIKVSSSHGGSKADSEDATNTEPKESKRELRECARDSKEESVDTSNKVATRETSMGYSSNRPIGGFSKDSRVDSLKNVKLRDSSRGRSNDTNKNINSRPNLGAISRERSKTVLRDHLKETSNIVNTRDCKLKSRDSSRCSKEDTPNNVSSREEPTEDLRFSPKGHFRRESRVDSSKNVNLRGSSRGSSNDASKNINSRPTLGAISRERPKIVLNNNSKNTSNIVPSGAESKQDINNSLKEGSKDSCTNVHLKDRLRSRSNAASNIINSIINLRAESRGNLNTDFKDNSEDASNNVKSRGNLRDRSRSGPKKDDSGEVPKEILRNSILRGSTEETREDLLNGPTKYSKRSSRGTSNEDLKENSKVGSRVDLNRSSSVGGTRKVSWEDLKVDSGTYSKENLRVPKRASKVDIDSREESEENLRSCENLENCWKVAWEDIKADPRKTWKEESREDTKGASEDTGTSKEETEDSKTNLRRYLKTVQDNSTKDSKPTLKKDTSIDINGKISNKDASTIDRRARSAGIDRNHLITNADSSSSFPTKKIIQPKPAFWNYTSSNNQPSRNSLVKDEVVSKDHSNDVLREGPKANCRNSSKSTDKLKSKSEISSPNIKLGTTRNVSPKPGKPINASKSLNDVKTSKNCNTKILNATNTSKTPPSKSKEVSKDRNLKKPISKVLNNVPKHDVAKNVAGPKSSNSTNTIGNKNCPRLEDLPNYSKYIFLDETHSCQAIEDLEPDFDWTDTFRDVEINDEINNNSFEVQNNILNSTSIDENSIYAQTNDVDGFNNQNKFRTVTTIPKINLLEELEGTVLKKPDILSKYLRLVTKDPVSDSKFLEDTNIATYKFWNHTTAAPVLANNNLDYARRYNADIHDSGKSSDASKTSKNLDNFMKDSILISDRVVDQEFMTEKYDVTSRSYNVTTSTINLNSPLEDQKVKTNDSQGFPEVSYLETGNQITTDPKTTFVNRNSEEKSDLVVDQKSMAMNYKNLNRSSNITTSTTEFVEEQKVKTDDLQGVYEARYENSGNQITTEPKTIFVDKFSKENISKSDQKIMEETGNALEMYAKVSSAQTELVADVKTMKRFLEKVANDLVDDKTIVETRLEGPATSLNNDSQKDHAKTNSALDNKHSIGTTSKSDILLVDQIIGGNGRVLMDVSKVISQKADLVSDVKAMEKILERISKVLYGSKDITNNNLVEDETIMEVDRSELSEISTMENCKPEIMQVKTMVSNKYTEEIAPRSDDPKIPDVKEIYLDFDSKIYSPKIDLVPDKKDTVKVLKGFFNVLDSYSNDISYKSDMMGAKNISDDTSHVSKELSPASCSERDNEKKMAAISEENTVESAFAIHQETVEEEGYALNDNSKVNCQITDLVTDLRAMENILDSICDVLKSSSKNVPSKKCLLGEQKILEVESNDLNIASEVKDEGLNTENVLVEDTIVAASVTTPNVDQNVTKEERGCSLKNSFTISDEHFDQMIVESKCIGMNVSKSHVRNVGYTNLEDTNAILANKNKKKYNGAKMFRWVSNALSRHVSTKLGSRVWLDQANQDKYKFWKHTNPMETFREYKFGMGDRTGNILDTTDSKLGLSVDRNIRTAVVCSAEFRNGRGLVANVCDAMKDSAKTNEIKCFGSDEIVVFSNTSTRGKDIDKSKELNRINLNSIDAQSSLRRREFNEQNPPKSSNKVDYKSLLVGLLYGTMLVSQNQSKRQLETTTAHNSAENDGTKETSLMILKPATIGSSSTNVEHLSNSSTSSGLKTKQRECTSLEQRNIFSGNFENISDQEIERSQALQQQNYCYSHCANLKHQNNYSPGIGNFEHHDRSGNYFDQRNNFYCPTANFQHQDNCTTNLGKHHKLGQGNNFSGQFENCKQSNHYAASYGNYNLQKLQHPQTPKHPKQQKIVCSCSNIDHQRNCSEKFAHQNLKDSQTLEVQNKFCSHSVNLDHLNNYSTISGNSGLQKLEHSEQLQYKSGKVKSSDADYIDDGVKGDVANYNSEGSFLYPTKPSTPFIVPAASFLYREQDSIRPRNYLQYFDTLRNKYLRTNDRSGNDRMFRNKNGEHTELVSFPNVDHELGLECLQMIDSESKRIGRDFVGTNLIENGGHESVESKVLFVSCDRSLRNVASINQILDNLE